MVRKREVLLCKPIAAAIVLVALLVNLTPLVGQKEMF